MIFLPEKIVDTAVLKSKINNLSKYLFTGKKLTNKFVWLKSVFFTDYSQINYKGIQSEVWEKWTWRCNDLCQIKCWSQRSTYCRLDMQHFAALIWRSSPGTQLHTTAFRCSFIPFNNETGGPRHIFKHVGGSLMRADKADLVFCTCWPVARKIGWLVFHMLACRT
jgi:hypothetical protein